MLLAVLALAPSAYLALLSADMPHLGSFSDDGLYWVSAKSLAEGTGYRLISLPGQPEQTKYPPLFPAYLSLVWKLSPEFPQNLRLATLAAWIWLPVFMVICYPAFRHLGMSRTCSLILCGLVAVSPTVSFFGIKLLSELMFCCLLLGALIAIEHVERCAAAQRMALLAGALAGAAFLCRTVALLLMFTVPVLLALRRRRLAAGLFLLGMAPAVAGWSLWVYLHKSAQADFAAAYYTTYIDQYLNNVDFGNLARVIWRNLEGILSGVGALLAPAPDTPLAIALLRLGGFVGLGGAIRHARRSGLKHYHLFGVAYLLVLLPWNYPPNSRMLFPLLPLILVGVLSEIRHVNSLIARCRLSRDAAERATARVFQLAGVLLIGLCLYQNACAALVWIPEFIAARRAALQDRQRVYGWIRGNLPGAAGILAYSDVPLFLYTGRRAESIVLPSRALYTAGRKGLLDPFYSLPATARARHLDYVVVEPGDFDQSLTEQERSRYQEIVARLPGLELLFSHSGIRVYRVRASAGDLGRVLSGPQARNENCRLKPAAARSNVRHASGMWRTLQRAAANFSSPAFRGEGA